MACEQRRHPRRATSPALTLDITLSSTIVTHTEHTLYNLVIKTFSVVNGNRTATEPGKFIRPRVDLAATMHIRTQAHLLVQS